jgi:hypothetical protein
MSVSEAWKSIKNVAADRLGKGGVGDGVNRLNEICTKAKWGVRIRAWPLASFFIFSFVVVLLLVLLAIIARHEGSKTTPEWWNIAILSFISACFAAVILIYLIQHIEPFRRIGRLSPECYPAELEELFADLRSGVWEAKSPSGLLPMHFFASEWRTLLAAGPDFNGARFWVRDKNGFFCGGDIEVRRTPIDQIAQNLPEIGNIETRQVKAANYSEEAAHERQPSESDIESPRESTPKREIYPPFEEGALIRNNDYWLAGISQGQFELGLEKYLAATCKDNPYKERVETIILTTGRNTLRAGKSQVDAIDDIILALEASKLNCPARTTIKARLGGSQVLGGKEIRAYFTDIPSAP